MQLSTNDRRSSVSETDSLTRENCDSSCVFLF
jgi:hypothetical protein